MKMRFVLNRCWGGFSLSEQAAEALGLESGYSDIRRDDPDLIALIEDAGSEWVSGHCASLAIVEIPDDATDWEMDEYDGIESITYVVGGKLYHA
jgi:hypothetical protein